MVTIKYFGYDVYELANDLGSGKLIYGREPQGFSGFKFKSVGGCLKYISHYIGTQYHKCDWVFEEDLDGNGNDGYVLHILVDKDFKWADEKMISSWRKGNLELRDLLVNVIFQ